MVASTPVKFEFDNTDARTANISKIGTGDNQLLNDISSTIMYHDGSGNLGVSDAGLGSIIVGGTTAVGRLMEPITPISSLSMRPLGTPEPTPLLSREISFRMDLPVVTLP